ncbi:MAG TPA: copper homeostasis periplasmic binding protein CopC [Terriglobales bacterium]|nr:copper homeostasis periplasmic binding protein CopC [Terriglobales bacterium]
MIKKTFIIAASLPLLLLASRAQAHAHLDHASPAVGSTVAAPKSVTLWFTESLEPAFSTIEVRDAKGAAMQAGKATVDPGNHAELHVPLKSLPPGTYKVIWRVLSVDTHRTQGDFTFTVGH